MTKKDFEKLNKEQKKKGGQMFANPRNVVAGSIRQLDPIIAASRPLSFYGYAIRADLGFITHEQQHEFMKLIGIPTNARNHHTKTLKDVEVYHDKIAKMRDTLPYMLDGIVVAVDDQRTFDRLGIVGKAPRGMIAYKFPAEQATTVVKEVRWQVGRTGVLTPVAIMEPVSVGGTTVRHATLHNMDEIERLGLKIGDTVILERAGDVIPKIVEVLGRMRSKDAKTISVPKHCLVCGHEVARKKGEVAIMCTNKKCPAKNSRAMMHFVSRKAFDIDGLGIKIVKQLMDVGLIATPADIFKLEKSDLIDLERFADKSAENLIASINAARAVTLPRFIFGLGIKHVGEETAIDLANHFGSVEQFRNATAEHLTGLPGIGGVVAHSIVEWLGDGRNQKLIIDLLARGVRVGTVRTLQHRPLAEKTFVFTGELEGMTRDEAKDAVRKLGASASSSISAQTDFVVAGADHGSKYDKAKKLGVKILNEKEFLSILK